MAHPLHKAQRALERAEERLVELRMPYDAKQEFEAWNSLLDELNQISNMIVRCTKLSKKVHNAYVGKWKGTLKHDPLLVYLRHARIEQMHGESSALKARHVVQALGGIVENVQFDGEYGVKRGSIESNKEALITHEYEMELVPIISDGEPVFPPKTHLGENIFDPTPSTVASLGIAFYRQVIQQVRDLLSP